MTDKMVQGMLGSEVFVCVYEREHRHWPKWTDAGEADGVV